MFEGINAAVLIAGPLVGLGGMFAGGYWGVGCGWLIVPVMLMIGTTPMEAVGIALLQMVPSTLPTVIRTANTIGWGKGSLGRNIVLPMGAGAFAASFAGQPINRVMYRLFGASALMVLFACVMIVIGIQTCMSRPAAEHSGEGQKFGTRATVNAVLAGFATGVFSSVLGVGGAVLMRPILSSGFKVNEKETSVAIRILLLVTTLTGGATYLFEDGGFQMRVLVLTVLISLGGMAGFPFGVKLHNQVYAMGYATHIHKSFAVISVIVVINTILKLCGLTVLNRWVMISFAVLLLVYLLGFGEYAKRHPKTGGMMD